MTGPAAQLQRLFDFRVTAESHQRVSAEREPSTSSFHDTSQNHSDMPCSSIRDLASALLCRSSKQARFSLPRFQLQKNTPQPSVSSSATARPSDHVGIARMSPAGMSWKTSSDVPNACSA